MENKKLTPEQKKHGAIGCLFIVVAVAMIAFFITMCSSGDKELTIEEQAKPITDLAKEHAKNASETQRKYAQDVVYLYEQLQTFRHNPEFHAKGMAWKGITQWLENVQSLNDRYPKDDILTTTVMPGDLEQIARDYYQNKGAETHYNKSISVLVNTLKAEYAAENSEKK